MTDKQSVKVHTITKPVWDMTGGEKRKYSQKDHPEFLIDIIKKSEHDQVVDSLLQELKDYREALKEVSEFKLTFKHSEDSTGFVPTTDRFPIDIANEVLEKYKVGK